MKLTPLLLAAFALPSALLAYNATASVDSVAGQTRATGAEALAVGAKISEGASIETNRNSGLTLKFPNGSKVKLGSGTRIRLRQLQQSDTPSVYSYEIALLRGTLTGNATGSASSSNFTISTTAGNANVAGSNFSLSFSPVSGKGGSFSVASSTGPIVLMPTGSTAPVVLPSGSRTSVGQSGAAPIVVAASTSNSSDSPDSSAASSGTPAGASDKTVVLPNFVKPTLPNLSILVISPNGEGTLN